MNINDKIIENIKILESIKTIKSILFEKKEKDKFNKRSCVSPSQITKDVNDLIYQSQKVALMEDV